MIEVTTHDLGTEQRSPLWDTIIVPLDGSEPAETAVPCGLALAQQTGAPLVLLRVLDEPRFIRDAAGGNGTWIDARVPRLELSAPDVLEPVGTRLREAGARMQAIIRLGEAGDEIVAEADRHPRTLIVMASRGLGGLQRLRLGSVATQVLQRAAGPVLIVRARSTAEPGEHGGPCRFPRVIVPLDGSKRAERALPVAGTLARALQVDMHLVRVAETYSVAWLAERRHYRVSGSHPHLAAHVREVEDLARTYLDDIGHRTAAGGWPVTWELLSGDPGQELVTVAQRNASSLIVMTTHRRGGLGRWYYGSVADTLLRQAEAPILLLRAAGDG